MKKVDFIGRCHLLEDEINNKLLVFEEIKTISGWGKEELFLTFDLVTTKDVPTLFDE